ncbi:putative bleomycin hydrolase [Helianthus annuus]|nr:putative bleomycin hydrolase [Helianthus annuus]
MSQQKLTAPYGSWSSPITSDIVSGAGKTLCGTAVDSFGRLLWLESRPTESGRSVVVKGGDDEATDITPKGFSVRTLANEYGGGDFSVSGDTVFFSNYDDQRLYKQSIDSKGLKIYKF